MALQAYLDATNRLLTNPVPSPPLYPTADLTSYINEARQQLAGDAQCIRATAVGTVTAGQQVTAFSAFTSFPLSTVATGSIFFPANPSNGDTITLNAVAITFVSGSPSGNQVHIDATAGITIGVNLFNFLTTSVNPSLTVAAYIVSGGPATATLGITYKTAGTAGNAYTLAASAATPSGATLTGGGLNMPGIQGVLTIRQLAVNTSSTIYKVITSRPWPWFNRYFIANGVALVNGTPTTWAQQGLGSQGNFGVGPVPNTNTTVQADVVCLPIALVTDLTPEAIPYPFTDAIPYYAVYKAYLSSQRTEDATVMLQRYEQFVRRAVEETTPTVLPGNYLGGVGAQIAASKQQLTLAQQGQKGPQ